MKVFIIVFILPCLFMLQAIASEEASLWDDISADLEEVYTQDDYYTDDYLKAQGRRLGGAISLATMFHALHRRSKISQTKNHITESLFGTSTEGENQEDKTPISEEAQTTE